MSENKSDGECAASSLHEQWKDEERDTRTIEAQEVLDAIQDVEVRILSEDKTGATRDDVAEATCVRIWREIDSRAEDIHDQ